MRISRSKYALRIKREMDGETAPSVFQNGIGLEQLARYRQAFKDAEHKAQHGPVRVIMKDGKKVEP